MNNTSTYIDFENVSSIIELWNQANSNFMADNPTTDNTSSDGFNLIREAGFDTHSFDQYNQNVNKLTNSLLECFSATRDYVSGMEGADSYLDNNIPEYILNINNSAISAANVNINIEDKLNDIHDSNMRDLKEEAEKVNNKRAISNSQYSDQYQAISTTNVKNINNDKTVETSEYSDGYQKISATNINNINKDVQQQVVGFDDSGLGVNTKGLYNMKKDNINLNQKPFDYTTLNTSVVSLKSIIKQQTDMVKKVIESNINGKTVKASILGNIKPKVKNGNYVLMKN